MEEDKGRQRTIEKDRGRQRVIDRGRQTRKRLEEREGCRASDL